MPNRPRKVKPARRGAEGRAHHEEPIYFTTPAKLRAWLKKHHASRAEAWVGLHKKGTRTPSITWPELVDQLLCFGWIDGVRKSVDQDRYKIRVTPRKPGSHWSLVNLRRARELMEVDLMESAGLAAFEVRDEPASRRYSYERAHAALASEHEKALRANRAAWAFFSAQPPWYRKAATAWVMTAKREETRLRRLQTLIRDSAAGQRIGPLRR